MSDDKPTRKALDRQKRFKRGAESLRKQAEEHRAAGREPAADHLTAKAEGLEKAIETESDEAAPKGVAPASLECLNERLVDLGGRRSMTERDPVTPLELAVWAASFVQNLEFGGAAGAETFEGNARCAAEEADAAVESLRYARPHLSKAGGSL